MYLKVFLAVPLRRADCHWCVFLWLPRISIQKYLSVEKGIFLRKKVFCEEKAACEGKVFSDGAIGDPYFKVSKRVLNPFAKGNF